MYVVKFDQAPGQCLEMYYKLFRINMKSKNMNQISHVHAQLSPSYIFSHTGSQTMNAITVATQLLVSGMYIIVGIQLHMQLKTYVVTYICSYICSYVVTYVVKT